MKNHSTKKNPLQDLSKGFFDESCVNLQLIFLFLDATAP